MRSKNTSQVNTRKKRKTSNASKNQVQHVDDILNEGVVTRSTRRQPIQSSSSSNSNNITNSTTNTHETLDQGQPTNQSQEEIDSPRAKSDVWHYATKQANGKAKCHNCDREISCKDHSTTGLRRHLHKCLNISKFTRSRTRNISNKFVSEDMKKKLNDLVYECIVEDGRTFGDLRKSGMARFIKKILPGE
jgi:hypothetical protein